MKVLGSEGVQGDDGKPGVEQRELHFERQSRAHLWPMKVPTFIHIYCVFLGACVCHDWVWA